MSGCRMGLVGHALSWIIGPHWQLHLLTRHLCRHKKLGDVIMMFISITLFQKIAGQDQADVDPCKSHDIRPKHAQLATMHQSECSSGSHYCPCYMLYYALTRGGKMENNQKPDIRPDAFKRIPMKLCSIWCICVVLTNCPIDKCACQLAGEY